jgi:hypothetical protein
MLCSAGSIRVHGDVTIIEVVMQAVFSSGPLRGHMTRSTVFCSASECSAVEGSVVECEPAGNGSGRISIVKIRYQETSSEDTAEE